MQFRGKAVLEVSEQSEIFPVLDKIFKPKIFLLTPLGGVGCLQSQKLQGKETSGVIQSRTTSWNRGKNGILPKKTFLSSNFLHPTRSFDGETVPCFIYK